MKKLACIIVAILMLAGLMAGCNNAGTEATDAPATDAPATSAPSTGGEATAVATQEIDIMDLPKATISVLIASGPEIPDTKIQGELEDFLNCTFDLVYVPTSGADRVTKINLIMGDPSQHPDWIQYPGEMRKEAAEWWDAGYLLDLVPYLEKWGDEICSYQTFDTMYACYAGNGVMYSLPGDVSEPGSRSGITRLDWIEKLGKTLPTTYDELEYLIKAISEGDMKENGDPTTSVGYWAMAGSSGPNWYSWATVSAPFRAQFDDFVQQDGKVIHGSTQMYVKAALEKMTHIFKSGWTDPAALQTVDTGAARNDGKIGFCHDYLWTTGGTSPGMALILAKNPEAQWVCHPPVTGPDGFKSNNPEGQGAGMLNAMSKACKDPERAFKTLDKLASGEGFRISNFGLEGEDWEYTDKEARKTKLLYVAGDRDKVGINCIQNYQRRKDEWLMENDNLAMANYTQSAEYAMPLRATRVWFYESSRPMYVQYWNDLKSHRDEVFVAIINGSQSIDTFETDWLEFWKANGGDKVDAEATELYKKQADLKPEFTRLWEDRLSRK